MHAFGYVTAAFGLAAMMMAAPAPASAKELYAFKVGQWSGRAWQSDKTGKFSHCVVRARYPGGLSLSLSHFASGRFSIGLYKKEWRLGSGKRYTISILVDGKNYGSYRARALTDQLLNLLLPIKHRLVRRLRLGSVLVIRAAQRDFRFVLTDSAKAIDRIRACVELRSQTARTNGAANPFARDLGAAPARSPAPAPTPEGAAGMGAPASGRRTSLQKFIRNVLGNAGLKGINFEPPGTRKSKSVMASWRVPGIYGLYMVVKHQGRSIDEVTGPFLARLGKSCKGRYGYGADVARSAGKYLLKKSSAACSVDGQGRFYVFATSVRGAQSIVIITHVARGQGRADLRQVNTELENVLANMLNRL
jgi:hypothetical protein